MTTDKPGFSKTAFVLYVFLIAFMFIASPLIGLLAGKVLGAMAIGWVLGGIFMGILLACIYKHDNQLNNDFKWRFNKDAENMKGVKL